MEWLRKILESRGVEVTDELFAEVKKELPKAFIPKDEYNLKLEEIRGLKEQLTTRDGDIAELKKQSAGNGELQAQIKTLQEKYNKDTSDLQNSLNQTKFQSALEIAMSRSGAKNTKALKGLLDMEKIKLEGDTLSGLEEQIAAIREENDYLFGEIPSATGLPRGGSPARLDGVEAAFYAKNPDLMP